MPRRIDSSVQEQIRQRANFLCEYCHTDETWQYVPFSIDHVIPVSEGGEDHFENLALACFHCNRHKSNKQMSFDRETEQTVPIFNPREDRWSDHFIWSRDGLLNGYRH